MYTPSYNPRLYANLRNYGNYIVESAAVLSDQLDPRLKQYLEEDIFIEKLVEDFKKATDGQTIELSLNKSDYGIKEEDNIWVKIDKSDVKSPKFFMWIMNEEFMYGGIDFDLAATILYEAGNEGSAIGYIGNALGSLVGLGDPGDSGTDEATVVAVCGAMAAIAAEKGLDPKLYYDKLAEAFNNKHGSLVDFLETEFSGRAESAALAAFRQPVDSSVARGLNMGQILFDIGLTLLTFGEGTLITKTLQASARGVEGALAATKVGRGILRAGKGIGGVLARIPGWSKLAGASKATYLGQTIKIGEQIQYVTRTGKNIGRVSTVTVEAIDAAGVTLKTAKGTIFNVPHGADFLLGINPGLANKILDSAAIPVTALALSKVDDVVGASAVDYEGEEANSNWLGKGAEIMGWYDTLTADPNYFMSSLQGQDAVSLAQAILDLKKGSGFFGNTTDQEELAMALIIISLTPEGAKQVKAEYAKIDNAPVHAVLSDEIGGDLGMFTTAYWSACTGEGNFVGPINNILKKIRKSK